jgi:peptide-methionine (S)-S-oxide reductase
VAFIYAALERNLFIMKAYVFPIAALLGVLAVPSPGAPKSTLVLAGGCFWGVEAVFEHVRGVRSVTSGYAAPDVGRADSVKPGHAGIAEAVRVEYDSAQITYQQLLQIFFLVAHDPTQIDRQGPDVGTRYRSIVFVRNERERTLALAAIDSLRAGRVYPAPIATEVVTLRSFVIAEPFHQDFVANNPRSGYVVAYDIPKLEHLRTKFPALFRQ